MFNKPALFPKTAESPASRTIRPSAGVQVSSAAQHPPVTPPPTLSPQRDAQPPAGTAAAASVRKDSEQDHGSRLIVGPDVKLKGAEILDCDTLVVEGRVEATMDSRVIRIAEHGAYSGTVGIDIAEIHGRFDGELTARQQLIVHATGRVSGKIRYGRIFIEEGGEISGDVKSLSNPGKDSVKPVERAGEETRPLTALAG